MVNKEDKSQISYGEFQSLTREVSEMKELLSKMVDAINRISVLDERQNHSSMTLRSLDERTSRMEKRQQESEIHRALDQANHDRMSAMDMAVREMHIERERDKARFQTVIWMIRALWTVVAAGGATVFVKWAAIA